MVDGQAVTTVLVDGILGVSVPAFLAYLARALLKRHRGNLTRATQVTLHDRLKDIYISELREQIISLGAKPVSYPARLRPQDSD